MLRRFLLAGLVSLLAALAAPAAQAALAIDSQESAGTGHHSATSPLTWSFTNTAGTLLLVGVQVTQSSGAAVTVTASYNSVAMTEVTGSPLLYDGTLDGVHLFFLKSPATGAHTVSVTFGTTGVFDVMAGAVSFSGNDTTTPLGTLVTNKNDTTGSASASVSVTGTTSGNLVASVVAAGSPLSAATAPNTITWLANVSGNTAGDNAAMGTSTTSGGTVTPTYTISASDFWGIIAVEVRAAAAAPTTHPLLPLLDVGSLPSPGTGGGSSRLWAFFDNMGSNTAAWTSLNGISWGEPIDGLHGQSDFNDSFWFGDGFTWSPAPARRMMTFQWGSSASNSCVDMGAAAAGSLDTTFHSFLSAHTSAPPDVVRIWQEINGSWFGWSVNCTGATSVDGTANGAAWPVSTIVGAFQHAAAQVRSVFPSAKIEWNQNCAGPFAGAPSQSGNAGYPFDLYPGDTSVDVVGIDCYEKNTSWTDFLGGTGVNLTNMASFAASHSKKVDISETAAHLCDGTWITNIANWLDSEGSLALFWSYYDQGLANNGDNILYATTGTDSCAAGTLQAALMASSFGTKPYGGSLP